MKNQEIHYLAPLCSVALCMVQARSTLISKVVECFSPSFVQDGRPALKQGKE